MNPSDIVSVLQWWFVLLIVGLGFAPLTFKIFHTFFDKGYIFSKLLGLLLTGYTVFALSILHILPFTVISVISVFFALVIGVFLLVPQKWKTLFYLKRFWFVFAIEELIFLTVLYIWAFIHSFAPDIHGLEKYMDYGFINSILRTDYLPPKDMWFAPYTINYYYFGHFITAMLTKVAGISSAITFNLMLSTIVAFCFTETFSIGANLFISLKQNDRVNKIKTTLAGVLTALLVTFAGNLHVIYSLFKPYKTDTPVPPWQLQFAPLDFPNSYWYPNATRFIYNTIHEFPIYSWVVADLHGHVLDIPFVLLAIALFLALVYTQAEPKPDEEPKLKNLFQIHPLFLILIGLLLSCMYMTNAWDGAIYLLLSALTLFFIFGQKAALYKKTYGPKDEEVKVIKKAGAKRFSLPEEWKIILGRDYLLSVLLIVASFAVFVTPYSLYFDPSAIVSGIGVLCAPDFLTNIGKIGPFLFEENHCQRSPWWQLLLLYGFFFFFVIIFAIKILRSEDHSPADVFVLLITILATALILIPEFFYVKDIYPAHYRANTMFKLVFQAFIMLSICSSYIIIKTISSIGDMRWKSKGLGVVYVLCTAVLLYLVLTYPYLAVKAYYNDFKNYQGLNGTTYIKALYPGDYAAIEWLNANVEGQPVILESQSDSYTDHGRISANTGLPTVLGWTVHEWLWRGSYDIPAPRIQEVRTMYEESQPQAAKKLLDKYKVEYVIVGNLEYQKYPTLNEQKFKELGKEVFVKDTTKIYKIER